MLKISNLHASYSGIAALRDVSLEIVRGELVALIGANGAGKSTLLNCVSGLVPVQRGTISFNGISLMGKRPSAIARIGLLQVPEGRQILGDLSVEENLLLGQLALGRRTPTWKYNDVLELFPVLGERRNQRAGSLSGGEQQMLAVGRALLGAPDLLLLDEPSLGLAPRIVDQLFGTLCRLNEGGLTILLVEQNARRALGVASRAYILERGRLVRSGIAADLAKDPEVITYYLGDLRQQGAPHTNG